MYAALPLRLHSLTIAFLLVSTLSACLSAGAPEPPSVRLSGRIAYGTKSGIWIMNADGSGRMQVTHPDLTVFDYDPSWSPDGKQIAFRREPKNESKPDDNFGVMVVNVDGSGLFKLTQRYGVQATAGTPSWSADGFKIAVTCHCPDGEGIYVLNRDGSGLTQLSGAHTQYPAWSPNGQKIAYIGEHNGKHEIFVMNADGSSQTNLTNNSAMDAMPNWSPDGTQIVFFSDRDGNEEIYVMDADGSNQIRLTHTPADEEFPVWTPDKRIAFNADRNGDGVMQWYLINADGSGETELVQLREAGAVNFIDWLPAKTTGASHLASFGKFLLTPEFMR